MDHEYVTENRSVERYLLGELSDHDRDEFEEHYFSCPECAEAVRNGAYFADNAHSVAKEKTRTDTSPPNEAVPGSVPGAVTEMKARQHPSLWHRMAAPVGVAAAVTIAILGYQNLTGGASERPHILARTVLEPAARGEEQAVTLTRGQKSIVLKLDVNSDEPFAHYRVDIQTQDGRSIMHDTGDKGADGALEIEVPSAELPPGHYILLVHGQNDLSSANSGGAPAPEITRSRFLVKE